MATTVSMPQLGETVTEGTILSWAKQVGDEVSEDEVLVEISTDKVDTEVPSPVSGTILEILAAEGDTVEVGAPICVIGEAGEAPAEEPAPQPEAAQPEAPSEPQPPQQPEPQPQPQPEPSRPEPEPQAQPQPQASNGGGERTTVTMPQLGETVTEGTILSWAKQVGDEVSEDEVLVEISTDKVDTEVPSPVSGTILEILVAEGETVEVGAAICVIGERGAAPAEAPAPAAPAPEQAEQPAPPPAPAPQPAGSEQAVPQPAEAQAPSGNGRTDTAGRLLSPVVRKLVREHGVDVSRIEGSGQGGRVTRRDVEAFLAARERGEAPAAAEAPARPAEAPAEAPAREEAPAPAARREEPPARPAAAAGGPPPAPAELPVQTVSDEDEVRDLDRLRVRIGENMVRAKRTAAHVWTSVEVDYERVERVRRRHKEAFKSEEGFSLTYLPFIARATIDALREFPVVNSSFFLEERKAVFHRPVNLGVAIDLNQKGLIVATIKNADGLRLVGLARRIRDLADKARNNRLDPDDIAGSTFTITNPGPFGSFMSAPIINVPNTGILSTDTVAKRPAVVEGPEGEDVIAIRHIGYLGLTWDHRAFDGSTAVLFLRKIKENLETWDWEQELA